MALGAGEERPVRLCSEPPEKTCGKGAESLLVGTASEVFFLLSLSQSLSCLCLCLSLSLTLCLSLSLSFCLSLLCHLSSTCFIVTRARPCM